MLLRSVVHHVKAQNWTAIGIDFLIVVFGVFIGVQVDSWWDKQANAERERIYLNSLVKDFDEIVTSLKTSSEVYVDIAQNMSFLLEESRKDVTESSLDSLNSASRYLIRMTGTPINSTTYSNLVGSGDLSIISSENIKNALAAFYSQINVIDLVGVTHERQLSGIFQPYIINNLDYTVMLSESRQIVPAHAYDNTKIMDALHTQEFRNVVAVKWDIATDINDLIATSIENAEAVRALIQQELKMPPLD